MPAVCTAPGVPGVTKLHMSLYHPPPSRSGCFATGPDMNEVREALDKAVSLYLSEPAESHRGSRLAFTLLADQMPGYTHQPTQVPQ
jgi:hypothetical protein